jgi:hypothetical protein
MAKEFEEFEKAGEQFQKVGKDSFDAAVKSLGEVNKGLQATAARGDRLLEKGGRGQHACL